MSYDVVYTSCSVNEGFSEANWGKNNLICFGKSHAINLYDPWYGSGGKVSSTLLGHTDVVTSIKWLGGKDNETELVSGSNNGEVILWSKVEGVFTSYVVTKYESRVVMADGHYNDLQSDSCFIAVVTLNKCIHIYKRDIIQGEIAKLQDVVCPSVAMRLTFSRLPLTNALCFGTVTQGGHFILFALENGLFKEQCRMHIHDRWIHAIDFSYEGTNLLFATGSQDEKVKVWRISAEVMEPDHLLKHSMGKNIQFVINNTQFTVTNISTLRGHESWVYSVNFNPKNSDLLSTSSDRTMVIWHKSEESDEWIEKYRFGEIGANHVGYLGGMYGPSGNDLFAYGCRGAFYRWTYSVKNKKWEPRVSIGGHSQAVTDVTWEPYGQFILSVSDDRTARIHAPWRTNDKIPTWHQIARPQVHGYLLNCLAMISRYKYTSGADEKIVRIFKAPRNFIDNFARICKLTEKDFVEDYDDLPQGAVCAALGLSNKAVYLGVDNKPIIEDDSADNISAEFTALSIHDPPAEEDLLRNTLWPETHKLYGHGNELFAITVTHDGSKLATTCKATTIEEAKIIVWNISTWEQLDQLESHTLTVCQLEFSPDSKHLLSVSRDRRWTLFSIDSTSGKYRISATPDPKRKIHSRIIWTCAWLPNSENFATGSRDGKVAIWKENKQHHESPMGRYIPAGPVLELKGESVTALAIAPVYVNNCAMIAVGLESGAMNIYLWSEVAIDNQWMLYLSIAQNDAHHKAIKRLVFRKQLGRAGGEYADNIIQIASCGLDGVVRVFDINF